MHEQTLMPETRSNRRFDKLTKASALVTILCTSPLYFLYAYFGDPGKGRAAGISACVLVTVVRLFWDLRRNAWFWVTLSIMTLVHIPLITMIPWTNRNYPGVAILPVGLLDFVFVYGAFWLLEKVCGSKTEALNIQNDE